MAAQFDTVFDDWLDFLESIGFAARAHLNPPATAEDIAAAEAAIGHALPDDIKALYARADGQRPVLEIADMRPGTLLTPLFGGYDFVPLAQALDDYRGWTDVIGDWPAERDPHAFITVRGDDPVERAYWRSGWFSFAIDGGGNSYAADLAPKAGGAYGQVILIGPDEDERRVLAPSLTAFLEDALTRRPGLDPDETWSTDRGTLIAFFEMEPSA